MDKHALLDEICKLARRAGALELEYFKAGTQTLHKDDGSPVTVADQEAEKLILAGLGSLTPDIPVIAEESVAAGHVPDVSAGNFWLVDPLDGTREFVSGRGEFTVNIALMEDNQPVMGVIYCPVSDELYAACGAGTAFMSLQGGERQPIEVRESDDEGIVVVASRSHSDPEKIAELLQGRKIADQTARGSSLKFCVIASAQADLYPRFGNTYEWDTAAGDAILRAAGGRVVKLDGEVLTYGKIEDQFLNPGFIAMGSGFSF